VRVYSQWVYTAKCIVDAYCDWVYNDSSGCTGIVGIYSDWVYNANWKPVELWVHNASYIVGVSGNRDNSDTRVGLQNSVVHFSAL